MTPPSKVQQQLFWIWPYGDRSPRETVHQILTNQFWDWGTCACLNQSSSPELESSSPSSIVITAKQKMKIRKHNEHYQNISRQSSHKESLHTHNFIARRHHTHEIEQHLKTHAHTSFLLLAPNYEFVSHELPRGQCSHTPRSDLVHLVLALAAQVLEASSNHAG